MALFPVDELEALLILRASQGLTLTYAAAFEWFGHKFVRFQIGQLTAALSEVDSRQSALDRPLLSCLVVRASDGLPGQGWWISKCHDPWNGPMIGPEAADFVARHQNRCFAYWAAQEGEGK